MKVKTKKVPYIEMIGDWMRVTYKEEIVIEEGFFKRILKGFKNISIILLLVIILFEISITILSTTKLQIGIGCFFIGICFIKIIDFFIDEFKK